ncbi:hypothetical protein Ptr902_08314 [Pyrenophora tritici-repentis]|nr:hypothetical protein Alg130_00563 [Pyrenophora tritici-repentis]KAI0613745.1 hypothetical protein TUN205_01953 [Pyrenophora tritici-repentis]KAI0616242.1 hypothetical protein TUN199_11767 [Pyrenophora tritici-repentis]KAI2480133.1 hypothetical protein Ptr902_08314 [Pyrenophora tritici-repentis]
MVVASESFAALATRFRTSMAATPISCSTAAGMAAEKSLSWHKIMSSRAASRQYTGHDTKQPMMRN